MGVKTEELSSITLVILDIRMWCEFIKYKIGILMINSFKKNFWMHCLPGKLWFEI